MRGKLILKGGRNPPGPIQALTLTAQPPTNGVNGQASAVFSVVVQNATAAITFVVTGLPTGVTGNPTSQYSVQFSGTYGAAGTFTPHLVATEAGTGRTAVLDWQTVVAASASGIVVSTDPLYFGSTTPAGQAGIKPVITGGALSNAVINTEDGGASVHFNLDPSTGAFTLKIAAEAPGTSRDINCTFTGADASVSTVTIPLRIQAVAGRSVGILSELNSAIAAWPTGTNLYLRGGASYGDVSVLQNKHFASASYITKHTGQAVLPEIGRWWFSADDNIWFTWIDFHWEGGSMTGSIDTAHRVNNCNSFHFEDCIFRGKEGFDPLGVDNGTYTDSYYLTSCGTGFSTLGTCNNLYVKRCLFKNLWLGCWTAVAPPGGVQEYWDNEFGPTGGSQLFVAVNKNTHVSMSIKRNVFHTAIAGIALQPAKSHTDYIFIAQGGLGAGGWACPNVEVSQNMVFKGVCSHTGKGIFLRGSAYGTEDGPDEVNITSSFENFKLLDNIVLVDTYHGIYVARMSGDSNVVAGNTVVNSNPSPNVTLTPHLSVNGYDHPPLDPGSVLGVVRHCGNILPDAIGATLGQGMTVVGANTNLVTGVGGVNYGGWANIFAGGALMAPTTRAELISRLVPKVGGPADVAKPPGAFSGHHTFPTNVRDPTGASMVDTNGDYWLT